MAGYILLAGGAEFGGQMAVADRRALELAGGLNAPVAIVPTAAAPDNNHRRAAANGVRWFERLGATNVTILNIIDDVSANQRGLTDTLARMKLVYLLGGFTHHLAQTLVGSRSATSLKQAYEAGAVIAGSSAGAMALCRHYTNPSDGQVYAGLGMVDGLVLPHHNTFGRKWAKPLARSHPTITLIGIDERTGMINDGPDGQWRVYGEGDVTLYHAGTPTVYASNTPFTLNASVTKEKLPVATPDLLGIIVQDMAKALAFYRLLGMDIPADADSEKHVEVVLPGGFRMAWDDAAMIASFNPDRPTPVGHRMGLAFKCETPAEVDLLYQKVVDAGYAGHKAPWDAFWNQRYAMVVDPDGNHIDLFADQ